MTNYEQSLIGDEILNALELPTYCALSLQHTLEQQGYEPRLGFLPNANTGLDETTLVRTIAHQLGFRPDQQLLDVDQTIAPHVIVGSEGQMIVSIAHWVYRATEVI